jgi:hypothetical protein
MNIFLIKIQTLFLILFVFVLIVDPTNTIFGIKDLIFIILVIFLVINHSKFSQYSFLNMIFILLIFTATFIRGYLSGYSIDFSEAIATLKSIAPLILLFWAKRIKLLDYFTLPLCIVSIIIIIVFLLYKLNPFVFNLIYHLSKSYDSTIMIGHRNFLGYNVLSLFYKSSPLLIISASFYTYYFFNRPSHRIRHFLMIVLFVFALILSGTRANVLAAILIILVNIIFCLNKSDLAKLFIIPFFAIIFVTVSLFLYLLMSDTKEESIVIKFSHLDSYKSLISEQPSVLVFGQGPGSLFYSKGRNQMVSKTEWSYLELIRIFGLLGSLFFFIILTIPLFIIFIYRDIFIEWFPMFFGYFIYLIVGGTNPLLLGSTGMLVILSSYSFILNPIYRKDEFKDIYFISNIQQRILSV